MKKKSLVSECHVCHGTGFYMGISCENCNGLGFGTTSKYPINVKIKYDEDGQET